MDRWLYKKFLYQLLSEKTKLKEIEKMRVEKEL